MVETAEDYGAGAFEARECLGPVSGRARAFGAKELDARREEVSGVCCHSTTPQYSNENTKHLDVNLLQPQRLRNRPGTMPPMISSLGK